MKVWNTLLSICVWYILFLINVIKNPKSDINNLVTFFYALTQFWCLSSHGNLHAPKLLTQPLPTSDLPSWKKNKQKKKKIKIKLSADRNSQHYSRDLNSDILTFVFSPISSLFDLDVFFFPEFKIHQVKYPYKLPSIMKLLYCTSEAQDDLHQSVVQAWSSKYIPLQEKFNYLACAWSCSELV